MKVTLIGLIDLDCRDRRRVVRAVYETQELDFFDFHLLASHEASKSVKIGAFAASMTDFVFQSPSSYADHIPGCYERISHQNRANGAARIHNAQNHYSGHYSNFFTG